MLTMFFLKHREASMVATKGSCSKLLIHVTQLVKIWMLKLTIMPMGSWANIIMILRHYSISSCLSKIGETMSMKLNEAALVVLYLGAL